MSVEIDISSEPDITVFYAYENGLVIYMDYFEMDNILIAGGRSCGKSELWTRSLYSAIKARPDKKIIIGCTDQKLMLERLRKYFPNALFELVSTYGVSIHLRD